MGTAAWMQPFLIMFMKKFLIFSFLLLLLIISEYFLLNELFSYRRLFILLPSLLGTLVFIYILIRFFKKYILPAKHP